VQKKKHLIEALELNLRGSQKGLINSAECQERAVLSIMRQSGGILNQRLNKQSEFHKKHTLAVSHLSPSWRSGGASKAAEREMELRHSGAAAQIFLFAQD
jgi:hypothetical protein